MPEYPPVYRGRFAPSPSGPLHFGSLIAATASYLQAHQQQGEWLLRIEDVDEPRTVPGAADAIISSLDSFGFQWQGEILYQSHRKLAYQAALQQLIQNDLIFPCQCSRQQLRNRATVGPYGYIYPGSCRQRTLKAEQSSALRVRSQNCNIAFNDAVLGEHRQNIAQQVGDFIVRRRDQLFAYQLAVVVDDEAQGITQLVRGADLLDSTARQIYLQQQLNYSTPDYAHLPLAINSRGHKLSKKSAARAINIRKPVPELFATLQFLGQRPPEQLQQDTINNLWQWAFENWCLNKVPSKKEIYVPDSMADANQPVQIP